MIVWRIKRLECDKYVNAMFGTRFQAVGAMPITIRYVFITSHLDASKIWKDISVKELMRIGEYYNIEYGFHWKVVPYTYISTGLSNDYYKVATADNWCADFEKLEDGVTYDLRTINGNTVTATLDGTYGLFYQGNNIFDINDVLEFKEVKKL